MKCSFNYCTNESKYVIWVGSDKYHICEPCAYENKDESIVETIDRAESRKVITKDSV